MHARCHQMTVLEVPMSAPLSVAVPPNASDTRSTPSGVVPREPDRSTRALEASPRAGAARRQILPRGTWTPASPAGGAVGLVQEGLLVREVAVGLTSSAELLGPGDVVLLAPEDDHVLPRGSILWVVVEEASVVWLHGTPRTLARDAPHVAASLLYRAQRRIDHLAFCKSVAQLKRVEDRVVAMLWHLAERWGRVTPAGVVVELALTHRGLGRLVGAQRPSVTTALSALAHRGIVGRTENGAWRLDGAPPSWWHAPQQPDAPRLS